MLRAGRASAGCGEAVKAGRCDAKRARAADKIAAGLRRCGLPKIPPAGKIDATRRCRRHCAIDDACVTRCLCGPQLDESRRLMRAAATRAEISAQMPLCVMRMRRHARCACRVLQQRRASSASLLCKDAALMRVRAVCHCGTAFEDASDAAMRRRCAI